MSEKVYTTIGIRPIFDRVIVEPMERQMITDKGIIIPDSVEIPMLNGIVRAIGMKVESVSIGDEVLFNALSGSPYMVDDKPYLLMRENDLIAII